MRKYDDKDQHVDRAKVVLKEVKTRLHPEEAVKALRELETFANEQAVDQAAINDCEGVPDKDDRFTIDPRGDAY